MKIAIADRDPVIRAGLRTLLEQETGIEVVAVGGDVAEVVDQMWRHPPDLLLLDVRVPPITGIETILRMVGKAALASDSDTPAGQGWSGDVFAGESWNGDGPASPGWPRPAQNLTPREREIVGLIAEGLSNYQIAARLVLSPKTVKNHIRDAYRRMGVHGRREAIRRWQEMCRD